MKHRISGLGMGVLLLAGGSASFAAENPAPAASAPDYARAANWLCRPDNPRFCATDLSATIVETNGRLVVEPWQAPRRAPKIDCFYLYPTASLDNASNSDLIPGDQPGEEIHDIRREFARFGEVCRLFAPI